MKNQLLTLFMQAENISSITYQFGVNRSLIVALHISLKLNTEREMFFLILILIISFSNILSAQPNVLKCKKDCGILDSKGEFSFQVRLSMGPDKWGGNITFIEDDIAISQAHVLGINPEKKVCCTPKKIKKAAEDWKRFKNMARCY